MSLDSLLENDKVIVSTPATTADASGGFAQKPYSPNRTVFARVEDASSSQRDQWMEKQIVVTHTVYTRDSGIKNGYVLTTNEGLVLRVQGVKKNRGIGSMTDFYEISCEETRTT